jgi:tryptophanyl-tRNA synthetase
MSDPGYLDNLLLEGAGKASEIADTSLVNMYHAMGFLRR